MKPFARQRAAVLGGVLMLALTACGGGVALTGPPTSTPALPDVTPTGNSGGSVGDRAPEFERIAGWINAGPLTMEGLRGKVVLIDFWTYTCVNCIRTMPFLRQWHEKYADSGLVIVGVHSPEFEFEKVATNVMRATAEFDLRYPVAQDNDFGTWRAYGNRFWPAKYLVDHQGTVRYTHFGEGAYRETERQIRELLVQAGFDLTGVYMGSGTAPTIDPRASGTSSETRITREIYGGYERNATPTGLYIAHADYYDAPGLTQLYRDPGDHLNHFIYLQGSWFNGLESIKHGRETQDYEDYIALRFFARTVNAVIDLEEGAPPFEVQVTLDGLPLPAEKAGDDVIIEGGRSYFVVDAARMYRVVSLPGFADRDLMLSSRSADFALFALTFGAYFEVP